MRPRWSVRLLAIATAAGVTVVPAFAAPGDLGSPGGARADLDGALFPGSSVRIAAGATLPLGDLANEDPREGWVGAQGVGFGLEVGVRYPLFTELYVRPSLTFYRFGKHHDATFPVQTSTADSTLSDVDWTRDTLMGGVRVHLDYIPVTEDEWTPFLTGGLGLLYMRYHDELHGAAVEGLGGGDDTLGATAGLGVGVLIRRFEIVLAMTLQEPSFTEIGVTTWSTADLTIGYGLPVRF